MDYQFDSWCTYKSFNACIFDAISALQELVVLVAKRERVEDGVIWLLFAAI